MNESEMAKMVENIQSSLDPIFKDLPDLHEHCKSSEEADLHLVRAALRLRERYSHKPFYAQRAAKFGGSYWIGLACSAVNA